MYVTRGEGVQKWQIFADVIDGSPLINALSTASGDAEAGKSDSSSMSKVDQIRPLPSNPSQTSIPLQRLVQSVKQTKRIGSKILKEGWLVSKRIIIQYSAVTVTHLRRVSIAPEPKLQCA